MKRMPILTSGRLLVQRGIIRHRSMTMALTGLSLRSSRLTIRASFLGLYWEVKRRFLGTGERASGRLPRDQSDRTPTSSHLRVRSLEVKE